MAQQRVFTKAGHGVFVAPWQATAMGAKATVAVAVHVEEVAGRLPGHHRAPGVGSGSIHSQVLDVRFVKADHRRRQRVHSQPVQQPVSEKAPGPRRSGPCQKQEERE